MHTLLTCSSTHRIATSVVGVALKEKPKLLKCLCVMKSSQLIQHEYLHVTL